MHQMSAHKGGGGIFMSFWPDILHKQGSHGDWKTGKTGKMKMVREKSGKSQGTSKNDQKSGNFVKSQGIFADVSKITDWGINY